MSIKNLCGGVDQILEWLRENDVDSENVGITIHFKNVRDRAVARYALLTTGVPPLPILIDNFKGGLPAKVHGVPFDLKIMGEKS